MISFPRSHSLCASVLAATLGVALLPSTAVAQVQRNAAEPADRTEPRSWREPRAPESKQFAAVELRFGPYTPKIDDPFPTSKPYETVFGSDKRVIFGIEVDWQALRIPYFGTFGPGFGWSYTHMSALALETVSRKPSAEETTLGVMPMYGVGVLRFDELARTAGIPLVAYGKAGLGYGIWWSGNGVDTVSRGHTWGTQFALGAMVLLDVLDTRAAFEIDNEWGVNNTYFFFEWMVANLNDFKSSSDTSVMRIGTNTWIAGMALEL